MLLQVEVFQFLWLNDILLHICHIFLIHSDTDGHLDCFCVLAIVYGTAIGVHVSFSISVCIFSDTDPRVELLGHMVVIALAF